MSILIQCKGRRNRKTICNGECKKIYCFSFLHLLRKSIIEIINVPFALKSEQFIVCCVQLPPWQNANMKYCNGNCK